MEIGIDVDDDLDYIQEEVNDETLTTTTDIPDSFYSEDNPDDLGQVEYNESEPEEDFITELLKSRGILDKSKIKFETDEGYIDEVDWDSLSNEDKFNILNSSSSNPNTDLDENEIILINAIRQSKLTPAEYFEAVKRDSIDKYLESQNSQPVYRIDEISDDELFVSDLLSRAPNITNEEAMEILDKTKSNIELFNKQIDALRNEYRQLEYEQQQHQVLQQQQEAQAQFNHFAENIENSIIGFTEFSGCEINMNQEDMQELYDFITGFDSAGISHLSKALNDPNTLVRMAWFALNGEQMISDINEYYKKEISNVRKESYNKGLQKAKDNTKVVYKQSQPKKNNTYEIFDDLD